MSKTYRALAIVAVVAPLVSIGSLLLSNYIGVNHLIPSSPGGDRWIPAIGLPFFWAPALSSLAAPVIATFAAAVATESRRWGWLVAFIALGVFGVIGLIPFVTSLPFLSAPYNYSYAVGVFGPNVIVAGYSPMILLALVALLFALLPHEEAAPARIKPVALAIIVVVATLVSLVSIVWSTHNSYAANGSSFNAIGLPILNVGLAGIDQTTQVIVDISSLWDPVTNGLAAPIIATLAILVAAQARRWGWLMAFTALSILCTLGPAVIPELELRRVFQVNPSTIVVFGAGFYTALPMLLLVIAALVFALWRPRATPAAASAAIAPQAS